VKLVLSARDARDVLFVFHRCLRVLVARRVVAAGEREEGMK
jgi:hypothetical protein